MKAFFKYHLPAMVYALAILVLPSLTSFRTPVIRLLATDKIAHFLEYAIFAFLTYRSMTHLKEPASTRVIFLMCFFYLVVFGLVDEVLQAFIPSRTADVWDYVADLSGGLVVLAVAGYLRGRKRLPT